MAPSPYFIVFPFPVLVFSLLTLPTTVVSSSPADTAKDVHDILSTYNLPKGILPNAVKSYSLSANGVFRVQMEHTCYVKFDDQLVYYDKVIKGKLGYGSVSDVSGIQAKMLFLWVPVTGMTVDEGSGMVEFHVGALSKKLPASQFETIPDCKKKGCSGMKKSGFRSSSSSSSLTLVESI